MAFGPQAGLDLADAAPPARADARRLSPLAERGAAICWAKLGSLSTRRRRRIHARAASLNAANARLSVRCCSNAPPAFDPIESK